MDSHTEVLAAIGSVALRAALLDEVMAALTTELMFSMNYQASRTLFVDQMGFEAKVEKCKLLVDVSGLSEEKISDIKNLLGESKTLMGERNRLLHGLVSRDRNSSGISISTRSKKIAQPYKEERRSVSELGSLATRLYETVLRIAEHVGTVQQLHSRKRNSKTPHGC